MDLLPELHALLASNAFTCPLCGKMLRDPVFTDCQHAFCGKCLDAYLFTHSRACPTCFRPQTVGITIKQHITFNNIYAKALLLGECLEKRKSAQHHHTLAPTAAREEEEEIDTQRLMEERAKLDKQQERFHQQQQQQQGAMRYSIALSNSLSAERKQLARRMFQTHELVNKDGDAGTPTHLIVNATWQEEEWRCTPTFSYYWALSLGIWIVRDAWLEHYLEPNSEARFQVRSTTCEFNLTTAPRARLNLFQGQTLFLGPFSLDNTLSKEQARELIELNGGQVVDLGGHADGTQMQSVASSVIVLVGHPVQFTHSNNQCEFCANCLAGTSAMRLVEVTWIILCLGSKRVQAYGDRMLTG